MKRKLLKSIGIAILSLAIVVGVVYAFTLGTTDGTWGRIDSTGGGTLDATCGSYGASTSDSFTIWDMMGVIYNVNVGPGGETERYVRNTTVCSGDKNGDAAFAEWTRTTTAVWTGLGTYPGGCSPATGLFISEYVWEERTGDPDRLAVEIYNGTGSAINLATSGYSLKLYTSDRYFTVVGLTGTIASGDVHVVVNTAAAGSTTQEDQTITDNDAYRTVILVEDYVPATTNATYFGAWPETVQDDSVLDENMVRYGRPTGYDFCPTNATGFVAQSGFGFEGQHYSVFEPAVGSYFPVGRFCHYNNPIYAPANGMDQIPLALTINDIGCPTGQTYIPILPEIDNDLDFQYILSLDETPNSDDPCDYGLGSPEWPGGSSSPDVAGDVGPNRNGCADRVVWNAAMNTQKFQCSATNPYPPYTPIVKEYTVSIMGFTLSLAGGECPTVPLGTIEFNQIYSAENTRNCYCVYSAFTQDQITPVMLRNLGAVGVEDGILISWETVTETNNLGFNILRAESVDGEQTQVNPELIMSALAPGDMFGASYEYLDETALEEGVLYYYWLVDVPLDSGDMPGVHGPISAVR